MGKLGNTLMAGIPACCTANHKPQLKHWIFIGSGSIITHEKLINLALYDTFGIQNYFLITDIMQCER